MFFSKKKKPNVTLLEDSIWMTKAMRYKGLYENCEALLKSGRIVLIIPFFAECAEEIKFILKRMSLPYQFITSSEEATDLKADEAYLALAKWVRQDFIKQADSYLNAPISFLFPQHYPIFSAEKEVLDQLNTFAWTNANCQFYESMDSQLMQLFGSERMMTLLAKMGMGKDESLHHPMITKSIRRAQDKLASGIKRELKADSEKEWFLKNIKQL
ncbi:MAG: hypothetical protein ACPGJS_19540 [Flammeovirgaceae bacterium]